MLLHIVPLLFLPLQGHARLAVADAPMPCTMEQQGMHSAQVMMASPSQHPCDSEGHCNMDCQHCASCSHCPVGMALSLELPVSRFIPPAYAPSAGQAYSSVVPYQDHPPPRIG